MEDIDKIPFYKERTIGERLTAALDFLRGNWTVMLRSAIYLLLPLSIVQSVTMNKFFGEYMGFAFGGIMDGDPDGELGMALRLAGSYGILVLCFIIGSIILQAYSFTMLQEYNERDGGLEGVTLEKIRGRMWSNTKRVLKSTVIVIVAVIALCALSFINPVGLVLLIPALVAMSVPILLFPCVYSFEDIKIREAASRAIRLGFSTWSGLFVINLAIGFVLNIFEQVLAVPWGIVTLLASIFSYSDDVPQWAMLILHILSFVFGVLVMFVTYVAMGIQPLATAYHYAHATERKDSITIDADIDNFENLE